MFKPIFVFLVATVLAVTCAAQDLKALQPFVGTWQGVVEMEAAMGGGKIPGSVTFEWAPGEKALRSSMTMEIGGQKVPGSEGVTGWHPGKKAFYFVDIGADGAWSEGTIVAKGDNAWYYEWETRTADGQVMTMKQDQQFVDADTYTWRVFFKQGDQWLPMMKQVTFTRVKK